MMLSKYCLVIGGVASFLIALLHVALAIRPQLYRYFNAGELAEMHEKGSSFTVLVTAGLALMFAVWGFYALSGAGLLTQLPWLRGVLITIGLIYVLRGLMLPSEMFKVIQSGYPIRFLVLSSGSLSFGFLYLYGALVS